MPKVKTKEAFEALRQIMTEKAESAAAGNTMVSKDEEKALDPFLARAARQVREAGGKGARVTVEQVVERALAEAGKVWEKHNPPGKGVDSTYLSKDELQGIVQQDPALGALSKLACLRADQAIGGDPVQAVRSFFDAYSFAGHQLHQGLPGATRIDARPGFPGRAGVPAKVLAAYDFYQPAEAADWATVSLQKGKISGHDVWMVYATCDGDESWLEVLGKSGQPIASTRLFADAALGWDEVFGRGRNYGPIARVFPPVSEEGLSEPDSKAAAGQPPNDWPGDLTLTSGQLHHANGRLTRLEVPAAFPDSPHAELAAAAFEILWDRHFKYAMQGETEPVRLGSHRDGTLTVGTYTRPTTGKTYEVADWHDIDDGSYTFYFERNAQGHLRLAIEQFNN